jgi:hypothetical protein
MSELKELTERLKASIDKFVASMEEAEAAAKIALENIETIFERLQEAMPPIIAHYGERVLSRKEVKEYSEK